MTITSTLPFSDSNIYTSLLYEKTLKGFNFKVL
jgi:hypothetical protein